MDKEEGKNVGDLFPAFLSELFVQQYADSSSVSLMVPVAKNVGTSERAYSVLPC